MTNENQKPATPASTPAPAPQQTPGDGKTNNEKPGVNPQK